MTPNDGILVVSLAAIIAFVAVFKVSGLVAQALTALTVARETMAVIADKTLNDEEKEQLVRRAALRLFGQFGKISLTAIVVLAVPGVVMWVGDLTGFSPFAEVFDFLMRWEVITGSTVAILAAGWLARHK